jgi:hypothetical protein
MRRRIGKPKLTQELSMKRALWSFVARPLLLASMLTSTVVLAATCPGMPPSAIPAACHSKASAISQSAYTTVYNGVMQSCGQSGGSNCSYYAQMEASRVRDSVYASQYNQCISSGGPC